MWNDPPTLPATLTVTLAFVLLGLLALPALASACPGHDHVDANRTTLPVHPGRVMTPVHTRSQTLRRSTVLPSEPLRWSVRPRPRSFWTERAPQVSTILRRPPAHRVMDARAFRQARRLVQLESFSDDRMEVVRDLANRYLMQSWQAVALAELLRFSDDRVEALTTLYPQVLDPENFGSAYSLLTFSSDRGKLRRRIAAME